MDNSILASVASACKDKDVKEALSSSTAKDMADVASAISDSDMDSLSDVGKEKMSALMEKGQAKLEDMGKSYIEDAFGSVIKSKLDMTKKLTEKLGSSGTLGKTKAIVKNVMISPMSSTFGGARAAQEFAKAKIKSMFFDKVNKAMLQGASALKDAAKNMNSESAKEDLKAASDSAKDNVRE